MITAVVYMFGPKCSAEDFNILNDTLGKTNRDRGGHSESETIHDLAKQLMVQHETRWTTKHTGNWTAWATILLHKCKRKGDKFNLEDEIKKDPPHSLIHLFFQPDTVSDTIVRNLRRGSNTFVRLLDALVQWENRSHSEFIRIVESYRAMMTSLADETTVIRSEHSDSVAFAQLVLNAGDPEHAP